MAIRASEPELDLLEKRQGSAFQATGDKEEDMRRLNEQIRKAIEGSRGDRDD